MNKKQTGSYYTPKIIADFVVDNLAKRLNGKSLSILEPSSGDGIFINAIYNHQSFSKKIKKVIAVEKEETEIEKVRLITKSKTLKAVNADFLEFQHNNKETFSLVVGNPPYFKKNLLTKEQTNLSKQIFKNANLSYKSAKNIWATFLVRCISFTNKTGILALILPSDLKQVSFAKELRELLIKEFERVELITFNELVFKDCKGQDTILLIAERKSKNKGVFTFDINSIDDLPKSGVDFKKENREANTKWNHEHLSTDEFSFLNNINKQLQPISYYANAKPGVVTGANSYFIVDEKTLKHYQLKKFAKPIIQKGIYVNGSVTFSKEDFENLKLDGKPTHLIFINSDNDKSLSKLNQSYLSLEETKELQERYKLRIREFWYQIPNVSKPPEGLFFKRSHNYPKLLKNEAQVLSTDAAYYVDMKEKFEINNLVYSFYNSFTLAMAELTGRYYGGGVLELVPSEFKSLSIPYTSIKEKKFGEFVEVFENKKDIEEILSFNDFKILNTSIGLTEEEILKVQEIRRKLVAKRFREV